MQNASPNEFTPEIGAAIRQAHGGAVAKVAAERPALRRKLRERAEEYRAGGLADKAAYFEGIADAADEIAQQRRAGGMTTATHPMAAAGSPR